MDVKNAEVKLLKASQIEDGDVVLVKISKKEKIEFTSDYVQSLYAQIKDLIGKDKNVGIFFFPKELDIMYIKSALEKADSLIKDDSITLDAPPLQVEENSENTLDTEEK